MRKCSTRSPNHLAISRMPYFHDSSSALSSLATRFLPALASEHASSTSARMPENSCASNLFSHVIQFRLPSLTCYLPSCLRISSGVGFDLASPLWDDGQAIPKLSPFILVMKVPSLRRQRRDTSTVAPNAPPGTRGRQNRSILAWPVLVIG